MNIIKRIHLGLPKYLDDRVNWITREYRSNPLSHQPGGSDIIVEYHDRRVHGYDWIKFPAGYVRKIWLNNQNATDDFGDFSKEEQLMLVKEDIRRIFARKYIKQNFESEPFSKIWDFEESNELPWAVLQRFDMIANSDELYEYLEVQQQSLGYQEYILAKFIEEKEIEEYLSSQGMTEE